MKEIKCPDDLNQFLLGEPIFENPFPEEECEQRKFYGDCFHCFATAIASRDHQLKYEMIDEIRTEILQMPTISLNANDIYKADVFAIIDKYKAESEDV